MVKRANVIAVTLLVAAGCGGGAAKAPESPAPAESEPQTIEEAQARVESARRELGIAPVAPSTTAPASAPTMPSGGGGATPAAEPPDQPREACANACRAIASMRRAVDVLCKLAGEQDGKCTDARRILADSEARVARCGC